MTFRLLIAMSVLMAGKLYAHPGVCDPLPREVADYKRQLLRHQMVAQMQEGIAGMATKMQEGIAQETVKKVAGEIVPQVQQQKKSTIVANYLNKQAKGIYSFAQNNVGTVIATAVGATALTYAIYRYVKADKIEKTDKESR